MLYVIRAGFSVTKGGLLYTGGQSVELSNVEFEQHKHKLEGVAGSVFPITNNPSSNNSGNLSKVQLSINADSWVDFGLVAEIKSFQVLSENLIDLTDSFEYRQNSGKWQIQSLTPQTNLQIILNK